MIMAWMNMFTTVFITDDREILHERQWIYEGNDKYKDVCCMISN